MNSLKVLITSPSPELAMGLKKDQMGFYDANVRCLLMKTPEVRVPPTTGVHAFRPPLGSFLTTMLSTINLLTKLLILTNILTVLGKNCRFYLIT